MFISLPMFLALAEVGLLNNKHRTKIVKTFDQSLPYLKSPPYASSINIINIFFIVWFEMLEKRL